MVLYIGFRWGLLQMIKKDTRYSDTENTKMLNFFTDRVEPPLKDGQYVRGTFTFIHEYPKTYVFYEAYALLSQKMKKKVGVIVLIYAL